MVGNAKYNTCRNASLSHTLDDVEGLLVLS